MDFQYETVDEGLRKNFGVDKYFSDLFPQCTEVPLEATYALRVRETRMRTCVRPLM